MTDDLGYNHETEVVIEEPETREPETPALSSLSDRILFGVDNGTFAQGPEPNPGSPIDATTNKLPNWDGPFGDGWTAEWIDDPDYPSGHGVRLSKAVADVDDEVYFEQAVGVGGDFYQAIGNAVRLSTAKTTVAVGTSIFSKVALQYLDADDNPVGNATSGTGSGSSPDLAVAWGHAATGASPPTNAAKLRIRIGFVVLIAATPGPFVGELASVRNDYAKGWVQFAELDDPTSYAAGLGYQDDGTLVLGGDGATRQIAVPEVASASTPPSGKYAIYGKSGDSRLYGKNDVGTERQLDLTAAEIAADSALTGAFIAKSFLDAKGDLISASADNTPAKLTVGANDTILMADSAQTAGLKWVAPATPVAIGTANAEGTSDDFARGSHVHAHEAAHIAHDTLWDAKGDLVTGSGADTAVKTSVGADDTILMADAAASGGVKWVAAGTPSTQAFGDAATVGTSDTFTRGDHKHAMPATPSTPLVASEIGPTLAADTNDWNPTNLSTSTFISVGQSGAGNWKLTGIVAQATGRRITLYNATGNTLTLRNQNAGSSALNRFVCPGNVDLVMPALACRDIVYSTQAGGFWMVLGAVA